MININHFFYFDIPLSNIQKYLMKQEETLITKEKKKFAHSSEEQNIKYCEFCHCKIKNPTKHRASQQHKEKFISYDWKPLLELEEKYSTKIYLEPPLKKSNKEFFPYRCP